MTLHDLHPNISPLVANLTNSWFENYGVVVEISHVSSGSLSNPDVNDRFLISLPIKKSKRVIQMYAIFIGGEISTLDLVIVSQNFKTLILSECDPNPLDFFTSVQDSEDSLYQLVKFVHEKCHLYHKNLMLESIFSMKDKNIAFIKSSYMITKYEWSKDDVELNVLLNIFDEEDIKLLKEKCIEDIAEIKVWCKFQMIESEDMTWIPGNVRLFTLSKQRNWILDNLLDRIPDYNDFESLEKFIESVFQTLRKTAKSRLVNNRRLRFMTCLLIAFGDDLIYCDFKTLMKAQIYLSDLQHFGIDAIVDLTFNSKISNVLNLEVNASRLVDGKDIHIKDQWKLEVNAKDMAEIVDQFKSIQLDQLKKKLFQ